MARQLLIDAYDIRLYMLSLGWQSTDAVGEDGTYTVNFYRYDWHGAPVSQVNFYARTHELTKISETVGRAGRLALRAWRDFREDVPCQPNPDSDQLEIRQHLSRRR